MATRRSSPQTSRATGSSGQRRDSRELASQYGKGKKFKVKCVGSQDMPEFSGNAAAVEVIRKIRAASAKQKSHKPKASITIQISGVSVFDEKSKSIVLSSPIQKIKYVCHDHNDISVFAFVTQHDPTEQRAGYRLHCFQAEAKQAVGFVRSMNEVFQVVHRIMLARRQQQEQAAAQRQQLKPDSPTSDPEETYKESSVNLGFGIPPPPPSYKAAISKKNVDIFKKPEDVQTMRTVLPPPPKSASSANPQVVPRPQTRARQTSVPEVPRSQPSASQPALPRAQPSANQPALPRAQPSASQPALPRAQPSASQPALPRAQPSADQPLPRPQPSASQPAPPRAVEAPREPVPTASTVPRPQPTSRAQNSTSQQPSREQNTPAVVPALGPPPAAGDGPMPKPRRSVRQSSPEQPQSSSADLGVPAGSTTSAAQPPAQAPEAQVWQDWRSLEGQLSELAQEVGIDMSAPALPEGNFSLDDPFADDFFQTSFSDLTIDPPVTDLPLDSNNFFAAFPEDPVASSAPFSGVSSATVTSPPAADSVDLFSSLPAIDTGPVGEPAVIDSPLIQQPSFPTVSTDNNFEANFPPAPSSSEVPVNNFEANFPPSLTSIPSPQSNTDSFQADFGSASFSPPVLPEAPETSIEGIFPPVTASTNTTSFEADFGSTSFSAPATSQQQTIVSPSPVIPAPPSKRRGGGRPRPRGRGSQNEPNTLSLQATNFQPTAESETLNSNTETISSAPVTFPETSVDTSNSFVADFSNNTNPLSSITTPQVSEFSFDSTVNNESSLQLSNPLYQSQTNTLQDLSISVHPVTEVPAPFSVDPSWGSTNIPADNLVQSFPVDPSWSVQQPVPPPPQFNYQSPDHMIQPPVFQDPGSMYPVDSNALGFSSPPQPNPEVFSPPGSNNDFGQGNVDLTNNPFAGDFNSPPFALHSSTPQTPGNNGQQQRTVSPPRQPAPVYTGEDPFANLIPLALSPTKEAAKEPKIEPPKTVDTPKTTQPNQPKRPSLNELMFKQNNSFDILSPQVPELGSVKEETGSQQIDSAQWIAF